ncbi:PIG-L deacetylase family protein [Flagellimonas marinaquae]
MKKNILIVAPHCDDEVLGCGGIMAKYAAENHPVYVAIVTNGHLGAPELFKKEGTEKVRSEALKAHKLLGVKETFFLDFPAPRLDSIASYKLSIAIEKVIRENRITDLYIPHRGDLHKDHRITYESCLVAARPINENPVERIYAYETLSETEWAAPFPDEAFIPTHFVDISRFINTKLDSFRCFTTQIKAFPHPRSIESIENLSKMRGASVNIARAEAFMVVRQIAN